MSVGLNYLEFDTERRVLVVHPQRRNWSSFDISSHFDYHVSTLDQAQGGGFSVEVDASTVPITALMHVFLFRRLALYARESLKQRLREITVYNASGACRKLFNLLNWGGYIPQETLKKITFVDRKKSKKET